jgi:hypothetical protein
MHIVYENVVVTLVGITYDVSLGLPCPFYIFGLFNVALCQRLHDQAPLKSGFFVFGVPLMNRTTS